MPSFWVKESKLQSPPKKANGRTMGYGSYLVLWRRKESFEKEGLCPRTFRVLFNGLWEQDGWRRAGPPDDRHTRPSNQQNSGLHHWCRKRPHRRLTILCCASEKSRGLGDKCRHVLTSPCLGSAHLQEGELVFGQAQVGTLRTRDLQENLRLTFLKSLLWEEGSTECYTNPRRPPHYPGGFDVHIPPKLRWAKPCSLACLTSPFPTCVFWHHLPPRLPMVSLSQGLFLWEVKLRQRVTRRWRKRQKKDMADPQPGVGAASACYVGEQHVLNSEGLNLKGSVQWKSQGQHSNCLKSSCMGSFPSLSHPPLPSCCFLGLLAKWSPICTWIPVQNLLPGECNQR